MIGQYAGAVQLIPGCGSAEVSLEGSTQTGAVYKDCCDPDDFELYEDGVTKYYAGFTLSAAIEGIKVWPQYDDSKDDQDFGPIHVHVEAGGGVYVGANFGATIEGGEVANTCLDATCKYGSFGGEIGVSLSVMMFSEVCVWTQTPESGTCLGFEVGGEASTGIEGELVWDECEGSSGGVGWSGLDITLALKVKLPGDFTYEWTKEI